MYGLLLEKFAVTVWKCDQNSRNRELLIKKMFAITYCQLPVTYCSLVLSAFLIFL